MNHLFFILLLFIPNIVHSSSKKVNPRLFNKDSKIQEILTSQAIEDLSSETSTLFFSLHITPQVAERLRSSPTITWIDLIDYSMRKNLRIEITPGEEYQRLRLRASLSDDPSRAREGTEPEPTLSADPHIQTPTPIAPPLDSTLNVDPPPQRPSARRWQSIKEDQRLLEDLAQFAQASEKDIPTRQMEHIVRQGEYFIQLIHNGTLLAKNLSKAQQDHIVCCVMWYLEALAGQKIVINPETWQVERGFIRGGVFRIKDPDQKLFLFFNGLSKAYSRLGSSHFKSERKNIRGFDLESHSNLPLPGKPRTTHLHFGYLKTGEIFLKTERFGLNAIRPMAMTRHLINWRRHQQLEKQELRGEAYAHRESLHSKVLHLFQVELEKSTLHQKTRKSLIKKGNLGIDAMISILNQETLRLLPSARNLKQMLINYKNFNCLGEDFNLYAYDIKLKSCEALIELSLPFKN